MHPPPQFFLLKHDARRSDGELALKKLLLRSQGLLSSECYRWRKMSRCVYEFSRAAVRKYHRRVKYQKCIVSPFWRPEVQALLVPSEGCERRICSRSLSLAYGWSSCGFSHLPSMCSLASNFPFQEGPQSYGLRPTLMTSI